MKVQSCRPNNILHPPGMGGRVRKIFLLSPLAPEPTRYKNGVTRMPIKLHPITSNKHPSLLKRESHMLPKLHTQWSLSKGTAQAPKFPGNFGSRVGQSGLLAGVPHVAKTAHGKPEGKIAFVKQRQTKAKSVFKVLTHSDGQVHPASSSRRIRRRVTPSHPLLIRRQKVWAMHGSAGHAGWQTRLAQPNTSDSRLGRLIALVRRLGHGQQNAVTRRHV